MIASCKIIIKKLLKELIFKCKSRRQPYKMKISKINNLFEGVNFYRKSLLNYQLLTKFTTILLLRDLNSLHEHRRRCSTVSLFL